MSPSNQSFLQSIEEIALLVQQEIQNDEYPLKIKPSYLSYSISDYPLRGGKRIRPVLTLWTCGLLGENPKKALHAAVAVELFHNWTLVHDDIIDNDHFRRNQPSTHIQIANQVKKQFKLNDEIASQYGKNMAILTGDLQQGWAIQRMGRLIESQNSIDIVLAIIMRMQNKLNRLLISGEALDCELSILPLEKIDLQSVFQMMEYKTSVLLKFCIEVGAAIALKTTDFSHPTIRDLTDFIQPFGMAFQLKDDWLGIFGNESKLGKPLGSDLCERKATPLLLDALDHLSNSERIELLGFTKCSQLTKSQFARAQELILKSGASQRIMEKIQELMKKSIDAIEKFPDNQYRQWLIDLSKFMIDREK